MKYALDLLITWDCLELASRAEAGGAGPGERAARAGGSANILFYFLIKQKPPQKKLFYCDD